MAAPLDQWQERMERHFEALAKRRAASGLPLFALEHSLSDAEIKDVSRQLRARLVSGARLAPHWLLWTIYAAERGYTYEGGEYWQSFEQVTPGWDSRDRYRVSAWFSRFRKDYNGFKPSGPWASHFSIIAWPITHAVLPRYLQRQFARTLYVLRFQIARLDDIEPAAIGRMIAANAYDASTRFEQFLQQEELVGRMVLALLQQKDDAPSEEPLLPATLERIVHDLESIRNARGWLNETSRVVSDRFSGLGKGSGPRLARDTAEGGRATEKLQRPDIRPDLRLHYKGEDHWDLQIDIPSFKDIAAFSQDVRQFLRNTRCTLNGTSTKKPPGWLLSGRRQALLKQWPDPDKPLVGFEKQNGTLTHLLESECRMSDGPYWLFRIGRDGIAREIGGRIVRPGYEYIVVTKEPLEQLLEGMKPCQVNCPAVNAIRMAVPTALTESYAQWLASRGLELARTIRVWPAGFPGRQWDGEGRSEWLTTEKPCFGIMPDHEVETYEIGLNGKGSLTLDAGSPGSPTFVQLSELPPGRHVLTVRAQRKGSSAERQPPYEGFLELRVREPEPWMPGTAAHAGLIAYGAPYDAALNALWENEFDLSVYGPPSRQVTPRVILQDAKEETIFERQVCGPLELPVTPDIWKRRFSDFLKREKCEWRYLEATTGLLELDGGDLGRRVMRFEHNVRPLRWVLRQSGDGVSVRLVDETSDEDVERQCYFCEMERPRSFRKLDVANVLDGVPVESPGGLFIARAGKNRDTVVISTGLTGQGLEGLGVQPNHGHISGSPQAIIKLLRVLRYWHKARVEGSLAGARRRQVTDTLMHGLVGIMAGWDWARVEAKLSIAPDATVHLDRLQSLVAQKSGFASAIRLNAPSASSGHGALSSWYTETAARYQMSSDQQLCRFAIDLAVRPYALQQRYLEGLPELIQRARAHQALVRGARLAVLNRMEDEKGSPSLIPEVNA